MEQGTIRARTIELVNDRGETTMTLDGGGGDREPGIAIVGPNGDAPAVMILVRRDTRVPYIMAKTATGTVVWLTFDEDGDPKLILWDRDGTHRTIRP
jgi:riboflavin biosynthesis pyrimidine reductase